MKMFKFYIILLILICQTSFGQSIRKIDPPIIVNVYNNVDFKITNGGTGYWLINDTTSNKSRLFKSNDNFNSFSEIDIKYVKEKIFDRIFLKSNVISLINQYGFGDVYLWSFDDGKTWEQRDGLSEKMFPDKYNNENIEINYENNNYKKLIFYKLLENGKKKNPIYMFDVEKLFRHNLYCEYQRRADEIYFVDNNIGYYYGRENVKEAKDRFESTSFSSVFFIKTTNGGKNWEKLNSLQDYQDIFKPQFLDKDNGYVFCKTINNLGGVYGYLMKTTDGGKSWFSIKECKDYSDFKFKFLSPNIGLIWYNDVYDLLYRTLDGGKSFEPIDLLPDHGYISSVDILSDGSCYIKYGDLYTFNIYNGLIVNNDVVENFNLKNKKYRVERNMINTDMDANEYYDSKLYKKALDLYLKLEKDYNYINSENAFRIAFCYSESRKYDEALNYYEESIKLDPKLSDSYNNIGLIYQKKGDYERAQDYIQKAFDINPKELYRNNLERIKKFTYKLLSNDYQILDKYFPSHKKGSKLLYWQDNNTASYVEENYLENNNNAYANILMNYYINLSTYQVNQVYLQESGYYKIDKNELIYEGDNKMVGEYSITKVAFPLENTTWSVLVFQLGFIGYEDRVITNAGTFNNCLVLGKDYYKEYYAPDVGLVLVRSAISQPSFITEKELIDYTIIR